MALAAEHLVMGHLLRRNVLAYKAPPYNEGYDLICIHPDPRRSGRQVRVQVKSRYQTDCDRGVPVKDKSFDSFDFMVIAFLNIGYFYARGAVPPEGREPPEFFTLPNAFVRKHHSKVASGFDRVMTGKLNLTRYADERGFELIAKAVGVDYPCRPAP